MVTPEPRPGAVLLGSDFKALAVARSLGAHGIPCVVVDQDPRSAWYSRYVRERYRWPRSMGDPALVAHLVELAAARGWQGWLLLPMQDEVVELVARHTEELGAVFRLVTQGWDVLRWACDKRLTYMMAARLGVAHPRTWYPRSQADLEQTVYTFPVILKPAVSTQLQYTLRLKALPAADREELLRQYARVADVLAPADLLVQEIIPGGGDAQHSVACYCVDGDVLVAMTARRMRQYPRDYGLGSSFVEAVAVPDLIEPARMVLGHMRVTGMVEVEFKRDPRTGEHQLLDINVRPWGWHGLCRACGIDFPYLQYRQRLGEPLAWPTPRYGPRWMRLLTDLPAALGEWRAGALALGAYARGFRRGLVFSVFDWRDPLPVLGDLARALVRVVRRGFVRLPGQPVGTRRGKILHLLGN